MIGQGVYHRKEEKSKNWERERVKFHMATVIVVVVVAVFVVFAVVVIIIIAVVII